ncbi:MAG: META domain-containing protein [Anaerolineales bacterium]|nr:META domain-containing protein [Anaerolineales bacterium]
MTLGRFFRWLFPVAGLVGLWLAARAPLTPPLAGAAPDTPAAPALAGTVWNLTGYGRPGALTPPAGPAALDIDGERLSGSTGCNSFGVNYQLAGTQITLAAPGPMMTLMACPEPQMRQETDFLAILAAVTSVQLEAGQLTLTGPAGVLVYAAAAPAALEATLWQLSGLVQDQAVVSAAGDEALTLRLTGGQAEGFAGCNTYFGAYTLDAGALAFGPLGATRMYCEATSAREQAFLEALGKTAAYQIARTTLTLLDADGQTLMQLTAAD